MSSTYPLPLHVFRFQVDFYSDSLTNSGSHAAAPVCAGSFAECTGLEATMEPKVIKEGGQNYGASQRAGATSFATVVLKRGISTNQNMYQVFNTLTTGAYAPRLQVLISVFDIDGTPLLGWRLDRAMPVKYKFSDLNSRNSEIGIEELHMVHEGLWSTNPTQQSL